MSNSPLVTYTKLSPNHSGRRNHVIDTVSVHCMAGNASVETCGALFADPSRKASSNYGIGSDGRIALYVEEANCPNLGECYQKHTSTFMLLGSVCTRNCRFCNVTTGHPLPPDPEEPWGEDLN